MSVTDDQAAVIQDLFGDILTPDQVDDFKAFLSVSETTAEGHLHP